ncbi:hypothetical protein Tco_1356082, partial [Tanacetum coccineum]
GLKRYLTYEFHEVCANDELQSKKIIKFKLGGRAHNLTLLEFACRLGLYRADELEEDSFNVYFEEGLRSDEHFNAQEHQNGYANVAWLITRWMKTKGASTQKESQICYGQFISKIARKSRVLTDDVIRSLSTPIYCRDLDTTSLRDLINFEDGDTPRGVKRMENRQSYHWDRYKGVFEHMAGVYSVPLQGAYNQPVYAQPQYDQYYQQYPPPPP